MLYENDTISAISTPPGIGGIGIIRISGERAVEIADSIFHGKDSVLDMKDHSIKYGKIKDPTSSETIDEVMLSKMLAPNTYTREDIIEINCHGGQVALRKVLSLVLSQGARAAEPGEFTKRAFLNGRIDLSQAEAVIDVINSKTSQEHNAAISQLEGKLSNKLNGIIDSLLNVLASIEVTVDYPEHDDEFKTGQLALSDLTNIISELNKVEESFEHGRIIRNGVKTVIAGKPNAGKSTLLNELSGYERAIVTDIPGTTRDIIEEEISINGVRFIITDTAGIRSTSDVVEGFGVDRAKRAIEKGDLIIFLIDLANVDSKDIELLKLVKDKKTIILLNKTDLVTDQEVESTKSKILEILPSDNYKIISSSLINGKDVDVLRSAIIELLDLGSINQNSEVLITHERHKALIVKARKSLEAACESLNTDIPLDMISIDIRDSADYIGEITGTSVSEDLVDKIFSTFCVGK